MKVSMIINLYTYVSINLHIYKSIHQHILCLYIHICVCTHTDRRAFIFGDISWYLSRNLRKRLGEIDGRGRGGDRVDDDDESYNDNGDASKTRSERRERDLCIIF